MGKHAQIVQDTKANIAAINTAATALPGVQYVATDADEIRIGLRNGKMSEIISMVETDLWIESGGNIYRQSKVFIDNAGVGSSGIDSDFRLVSANGVGLRFNYNSTGNNYFDAGIGGSQIFRVNNGTLALQLQAASANFYQNIVDQGTIFAGPLAATSGHVLMSSNYDGNHAQNILTENSTGAIGFSAYMYQNGSSDWRSGFNYGAIPKSAVLITADGFKVLTAPSENVAAGSILPTQPSLKFAVDQGKVYGLGFANTLSPTASLDIDGNYRFRSFTAAGTVITDSSGNLFRANHFDYSGTLTASRTMTLGNNSFILDASGASSSPSTMLVLKGKESSFSTRFLDYQNESGTTSFRMSSTSSLVTLAALNSHDLRIEGVFGVTISNNLDRGFVVSSNGSFQPFSGLTSDPTASTASIWWRGDVDSGRLKVKQASSAVSIATLEDDFIGTATQVITASTHTPGGADYFTRYSAASNAIVVTLGASLREGREYLFRCTSNSSNTITFNADTGASMVFYQQDSSSTTTTSIVTGGGGTGFLAASRMYRVRRSGTVIWFM